MRDDDRRVQTLNKPGRPPQSIKIKSGRLKKREGKFSAGFLPSTPAYQRTSPIRVRTFSSNIIRKTSRMSKDDNKRVNVLRGRTLDQRHSGKKNGGVRQAKIKNDGGMTAHGDCKGEFCNKPCKRICE